MSLIQAEIHRRQDPVGILLTDDGVTEVIDPISCTHPYGIWAWIDDMVTSGWHAQMDGELVRMWPCSGAIQSWGNC